MRSRNRKLISLIGAVRPGVARLLTFETDREWANRVRMANIRRTCLLALAAERRATVSPTPAAAAATPTAATIVARGAERAPTAFVRASCAVAVALAVPLASRASD